MAKIPLARGRRIMQGYHVTWLEILGRGFDLLQMAGKKMTAQGAVVERLD